MSCSWLVVGEPDLKEGLPSQETGEPEGLLVVSC